MPYETLDDFIRDLPVHVARHRNELRGHDTLFLLETREGRRLFIRLQDGDVLLSDMETAAPDCTVTASETVLMDLINGRLSPAKAMLFRKINVKGSLSVLMSLVALV